MKTAPVVQTAQARLTLIGIVWLQKVHFKREEEKLLRQLLNKVKKQADAVSCSCHRPTANFSCSILQRNLQRHSTLL